MVDVKKIEIEIRTIAIGLGISQEYCELNHLLSFVQDRINIYCDEEAFNHNLAEDVKRIRDYIVRYGGADKLKKDFISLKNEYIYLKINENHK